MGTVFYIHNINESQKQIEKMKSLRRDFENRE